FYRTLSTIPLQVGSSFTITDEDIVHRLIQVLHAEKEDSYILFDKLHNISFTCITVSKKSITGVINTVQKNIATTPHITFALQLYCLCIQKRHTFFSIRLVSIFRRSLITIKTNSHRRYCSWWVPRVM